MPVEYRSCPWCMQTMIDPAEGIGPRCYAQEEPLEQQAWDNRRKYHLAQLMGAACKLDEAFQAMQDRPDAEAQLAAFHRRRIHCVLEMFSAVEAAYFAPLTPAEIAAYRELVTAYAEQKADDDLVRALGQTLYARIPYDQTLASLHADFFSFWCGEDILDWSWWQYFELTAGNLAQYVPQDALLQIMDYHFGDILAQPVQRVRNDRRPL